MVEKCIDAMLNSWPRKGLVQELVNNIEHYLSKFINIADWGEATKSRIGGQVQIGTFFVS